MKDVDVRNQSMTTMNVLPVAPVGGDDAPAARPRRGTKRAVLLIAVLAAAITAVYLSPVRAWLSDAGGVRRAVQSLGLWIYPVGIGTIALLVGCGVPRLLLCTVAGMTLGFWRGMLLGEFGTLLGYYAVFLFIRWGGRDWALHRWPRLRKWSDLIQGQGILDVILLRHIATRGPAQPRRRRAPGRRYRHPGLRSATAADGRPMSRPVAQPGRPPASAHFSWACPFPSDNLR